MYTGPQIASFYVYAVIFTTLWSCMTFSAGLPILYPVAAFSFIMLYLVYKCLLLKYYSKTSEFNEDLPLRSIELMKYSVLFHMLIGAFMIGIAALLVVAGLGLVAGIAIWIRVAWIKRRLRKSGVDLGENMNSQQTSGHVIEAEYTVVSDQQDPNEK